MKSWSDLSSGISSSSINIESGQALEKQMSYNRILTYFMFLYKYHQKQYVNLQCNTYLLRKTKNNHPLICGFLPISRLTSSLMEFLSIPRPSHSHSVLQYLPCMRSPLLSPFLWLPLNSLCSVSCLPIQSLPEDHSLL